MLTRRSLGGAPDLERWGEHPKSSHWETMSLIYVLILFFYYYFVFFTFLSRETKAKKESTLLCNRTLKLIGINRWINNPLQLRMAVLSINRFFFLLKWRRNSCRKQSCTWTYPETLRSGNECKLSQQQTAQPVGEKHKRKAGFELLTIWKEHNEDNTCQKEGKAKPRPHWSRGGTPRGGRPPQPGAFATADRQLMKWVQLSRCSGINHCGLITPNNFHRNIFKKFGFWEFNLKVNL